jgi:hypothetical protein
LGEKRKQNEIGIAGKNGRKASLRNGRRQLDFDTGKYRVFSALLDHDPFFNPEFSAPGFIP